jgi:hypothetical protein
MTWEERVNAVSGLGFTERQTKFLVTVALHSGYCLRRQYEAFAGIAYGKNVRAFLDGLVTRGLADRFVMRADRGHVYHVHGRALYRAIGEKGCRNRRPSSAAHIARKLMLLDVVIRRSDGRWFATESEKVELFVSEFGVVAGALPARSGTRDRVARVRYFVDRLPIFVPTEAATPHFVYLATDGHPEPFATFLRDHATLLRCLATWTVWVVAAHTCRPGLQAVFDDFVQGLTATLPWGHDELQWYFERRRLVDRGELAQVSVFDLRRYRDLRQRFDSPAHETLYAEWTTTGRIGVATPASPTGASTGTLFIEALPFAYEQFGSLPGVA